MVRSTLLNILYTKHWIHIVKSKKLKASSFTLKPKKHKTKFGVFVIKQMELNGDEPEP